MDTLKVDYSRCEKIQLRKERFLTDVRVSLAMREAGDKEASEVSGSSSGRLQLRAGAGELAGEMVGKVQTDAVLELGPQDLKSN